MFPAMIFVRCDSGILSLTDLMLLLYGRLWTASDTPPGSSEPGAVEAEEGLVGAVSGL